MDNTFAIPGNTWHNQDRILLQAKGQLILLMYNYIASQTTGNRGAWGGATGMSAGCGTRLHICTGNTLVNDDPET